MTYDQTRDDEQLKVHLRDIDDFITRCQAPRPQSQCPRQTVFFFPGGLACQLKRSRERFQENVANQAFTYDLVWLNLDTFVGGALLLGMYKDSQGVWRDKHDRIVIADGAVNFLDCTPHDGLITWCANHNVDLYVFNWDWRRRLDEAARFFVSTFLPVFQARVIAAGCPDPLADFSLIGHSFGGMVVNLILRGNDPIVANMASAITVATPFYGYSGQVHRWFEGDKLLNGPFDLFKKGIIEVISSLPALYALHFLDVTTHAANPGLPNDPEFPLNAYPSVDATTAGLRADPYYPQKSGNLVRYPDNLGFDPVELAYGWQLFLQMNYPILDPVLAAKFYNLRGVRTQQDQQTPISDTVGDVTWDFILPNFDPADPSPIVNGGSVPGDDTQPAWTTRLITNDPARCIPVKGDDLTHMFLMSSPQTLAAIASILCPMQQPMSVRAMEEPMKRPANLRQELAARPEDVDEFLEWLYRYKWERKWAPIDDAEALQQFRSVYSGNPRKLARRIMMDIMKRPSPSQAVKPHGGAPEASGAPPTTRRKNKPTIATPLRKAAKAAKAMARRRRGKSGKK